MPEKAGWAEVAEETGAGAGEGARDDISLSRAWAVYSQETRLGLWIRYPSPGAQDDGAGKSTDLASAGADRRAPHAEGTHTRARTAARTARTDVGGRAGLHIAGHDSEQEESKETHD